MAVPLDPRVNAYRPDMADIALAHMVESASFVEPALRQCVRGIMPLLESPSPDARQVSQIRYGEFVDVFEFRNDGFAWVQNRTDRYVGYLPSPELLIDEIADRSHRIVVLTTFLYPEPDLKTPPMDELTLGSYVRVGGMDGDFLRLATGGYVFAKHVATTTDSMVADYVFTAGRLLHVPYLWGGRTPRGLDCSGLVQLALEMAGHDCLRDSDQQREAFGRSLECHWRDMPWRRGDLVFFPGHVGLMTGADHILHANAFAMQVTVEPLADLVARGHAILAWGRLAGVDG